MEKTTLIPSLLDIQRYNIYSGEVIGLPYDSWITQNGWVWNLPALPQDIYAAFQIEEQSIFSI